MGNRRMISKTVTQTHRFLRLPLETQALYFHLIQNSDDDGVVEAFPVIRMIGANEDNLGLLVIKEFLKPLNDEMVYFITDFHEQNTIKKDRYKKSVYHKLLDNYNQMEPKRNQNGIQTEPVWNHNISKENISKDNVIKDSSSEDETSKNSKTTTTTENNFNVFQYYQERIGMLNGFQYEEIEKHLVDDGMEPELIKIAIDKAAGGDNLKRNFNYINSILRSWACNNIKTVEQQIEEQRIFEGHKNNNNQRVKFGPACSKY
ncbi:DnaD domain-containing protein [Streptococcus thermophilus]|nr:DnaD domain protein [Streptococcus thermophilus]MCE2286158.1 DnaD domain protein [Streptococcus thermophilus]